MSKNQKNNCSVIETQSEYAEKFGSASRRRLAFEKAWEIRNFEIELYWKRATYFWAFIAATFVGYFALISSKYYLESSGSHEDVFFVICLGFVLSVAWLLSNIGSKQWQKNWEMHIDLLEDEFTGPLYKMSVYPKTFSVSKINEVVSGVVSFVWIGLGVKYLVDESLFNWNPKLSAVNWLIVGAITVAAVSIALFFIYARGKMCNSVESTKNAIFLRPIGM